MTRQRAMAATAAYLAGLLAAIPDGHAHAFAIRYDLPLPLWHYLAGAGAAVALSFAVGAAVLRASHAPLPTWRVTLSSSVVGPALFGIRLASVLLFLLLMAAGLFGNQDDWDTNILPVAVWVLWWVGLAYVCALIGNVWALVNPWTIVAEWGAALPGGNDRPRQWTSAAEGIGCWPAVVLFLAFAWAELVWPSNAVPARLALVILAYSAITWAGMAMFGIAAWQQRGEAFSLFFDLFARFAPLSVVRGAAGERQLLIRAFGAGLTGSPVPSVSTTAFVIAVLATVAFDGIAETPFWQDTMGAALDGLYRLGLLQHLGNVAAQTLVKTVGLLLAPCLFFAVYLGTAAWGARLSGEAAMTVARRHVLSLVPIAIAYHLAHYLSYLLIQGQAIVPLVSDPFGYGWDLFGTRGHAPDIGVVDAGFIWNASVASVVIGHAVATMVGHRQAMDAHVDRRHALVSQLPLTALMVVYTMLGLWILSQPIVSE